MVVSCVLAIRDPPLLGRSGADLPIEPDADEWLFRVGLSRWLGSRTVDDLDGPRMAAQGGYLPLASGFSTVRYPIPQRTAEVEGRQHQTVLSIAATMRWVRLRAKGIAR